MEAIKKEIRLNYRSLRKGGSHEEWSEFLVKMKKHLGEDGFKVIAKSVFNEADEAKKRLREYTQSDLFRNRIRKYCNYHGYSDIDPCEVIEVVSPRKVIVRQMDSVLTKAPSDFHKGGFCGNFADNDDQLWECKSNENNQTIVLTLTKRGWGQGQYRMSDSPRKFYDYNF